MPHLLVLLPELLPVLLPLLLLLLLRVLPLLAAVASHLLHTVLTLLRRARLRGDQRLQALLGVSLGSLVLVAFLFPLGGSFLFFVGFQNFLDVNCTKFMGIVTVGSPACGA